MTERSLGSLISGLTKPAPTGTSPPSAAGASADPVPGDAAAPAANSAAAINTPAAPVAAPADPTAAPPATAADTPAPVPAAKPADTEVAAPAAKPATPATPAAPTAPGAPAQAATSTPAAPAPAPVFNDDSPEGYAARLQADEAARMGRVQNHNALQQEHPHMFMMADYLKNLATTYNPKAGTGAAPGGGSLPPGSVPPVPPRPTGPPTASAVVVPAVVPATSVAQAVTAAGTVLEAPGSPAAAEATLAFNPANLPPMATFARMDPAHPHHTGLSAAAPQRQGSAALGAMIEELQARIEALTAAHVNKARHVAGMPLLPVHTNGTPHHLPAITSAAAIEQFSDEDLGGWAEYYLGDPEGIKVDRQVTVAAISAAVGVPRA